MDNQEVYDIVEIPTVYGYSIIGKLIEKSDKFLKVKEPMILAPAPNGFQLRPIANLTFLSIAQIDKSNIYGYSKIIDINFIKKYEETILKLKSGLQIATTSDKDFPFKQK